jgi:hypothetical protein
MGSPVAAAALAVIVLAGLPAGLAEAADRTGEQPFGGPPQRQIEERPFGGPPPRGRSIQADGSTCRTASKLCRLERPRPIGADCSCPGGNGQTIPGKVE